MSARPTSAAQQQRLYHRLAMAAHALQRCADQVLRERVEVTTAQAASLAVIGQNEPVSQKGVARRLRLTEASTATMIGKLVSRGLVAREPDPKDGRAWLLRLTREGRRAVTESGGAFAQVNARIDAVLSPRQIDTLAAALDAISEEFDGG